METQGPQSLWTRSGCGSISTGALQVRSFPSEKQTNILNLARCHGSFFKSESCFLLFYFYESCCEICTTGEPDYRICVVN